MSTSTNWRYFVRKRQDLWGWEKYQWGVWSLWLHWFELLFGRRGVRWFLHEHRIATRTTQEVSGSIWKSQAQHNWKPSKKHNYLKVECRVLRGSGFPILRDIQRWQKKLLRKVPQRGFSQWVKDCSWIPKPQQLREHLLKTYCGPGATFNTLFRFVHLLLATTL